jgi:hypothetical protein
MELNQPGIYMHASGPSDTTRDPFPGKIVGVNGDGTCTVIQETWSGSSVTYNSRPNVAYVAVGGTPPATDRYFQAVDYSA